MESDPNVDHNLQGSDLNLPSIHFEEVNLLQQYDFLTGNTVPENVDSADTFELLDLCEKSQG